MSGELTGLLPCPFCGGEVRLVEGDESAYVQCRDVKMHRAIWFQGDNAAADEVREQWNRRDISFERKSRINAEFVRLYEEAQATGKHGHYENMFSAMHQAYAALSAQEDKL